MIAIAVSAALVAFAWVSGYMDFTTNKVGKSIQIQSISTNAIYVQNIGDSEVQIVDLYVDQELEPWASISVEGTLDETKLPPGDTATIIVSTDLPRLGNRATIKVVTTDGISAEYTKTFASFTSGSEPAPPIVYLNDNFDRSDSTTVGGGWIEIDSYSSAESQIANNRLNFVSSDDNHQPLVYHTFSQVTSGKIKWAFSFNFERTGSEGTYQVFMQLGEGLTNAPSGETANVAVNLLWAGTGGSIDMPDHEGFGYYDGTSTTQVAIVSGEATIEVIADLDANTFDLTITGGGAGGSAYSIPFDNNVNIDTVMLYLNGLHSGNFDGLEMDNVIIEES